MLAGWPETAALETQQQRRAAAGSRGTEAREEWEPGAWTSAAATGPTEARRGREHSARRSSGGSIEMIEGARGEAKKPTEPCRAIVRSEHDGDPGICGTETTTIADGLLANESLGSPKSRGGQALLVRAACWIELLLVVCFQRMGAFALFNHATGRLYKLSDSELHVFS